MVVTDGAAPAAAWPGALVLTAAEDAAPKLNVCVTGAGGYIASWIVARLLAGGHTGAGGCHAAGFNHAAARRPAARDANRLPCSMRTRPPQLQLNTAAPYLPSARRRAQPQQGRVSVGAARRGGAPHFL